MKAYIGGGTRTLSQRGFSERIDKIARELGIETFLPHRDAVIPGKEGKEKGLLTREDYLNPKIRKLVFEQNISPLDECDIAIMGLDGLCWGTTMELGYVYALKTKLKKNVLIIGIYTDPQGLETLDFMRYESCDFVVSSIDELKRVLRNITKERVGGAGTINELEVN